MNYDNREEIDRLYKLYQEGHELDSHWRAFFQGLEFSKEEKSFSLEDLYIKEGYKFAKIYPLESLNKKNTLPPDENLEKKYCSDLGFEIFHLSEEEKDLFKHFTFASKEEDKKLLMNYYYYATAFEEHLHQKFPGAKRFSLEGLEGLIPLLKVLIEKNEEHIVGLAMAHRGRLNVLRNIFHKPLKFFYEEFDLKKEKPSKGGDVKYHLGYFTEKNKKLFILPNPSHLEAINPVLQGFLKAQGSSLPIMIHGDASFAGQGIVYETFQLAQLPAYHVGGSIHIILDNLLGFTTEASEYKSNEYCSSLAKAFDLPILHVKQASIEAILKAGFLALEYRKKFKKDVVIRLVGSRKYGHNEGDEPRFTQHAFYEELSQLEPAYKQFKDLEFSKEQFLSFEEIESSTFIEPPVFLKQIEEKKLKERGEVLFQKKIFYTKLDKIYKERLKLLQENKVDWAMGEILLYDFLLEQNIPVRLVGQDSVRGTFSHRLLKIHEDLLLPKMQVYNSPLSEYAAMGFEYGYSLMSPGLTIWEAQFGDFVNGAQIVIDQFLMSAQIKWQQLSSLVLFLPHGQEGQGSEHSSARIERFLQLATEDHVRVYNPTTPAQLFSLLKKQVESVKRPSIVLTPKSFLRHALNQSFLKDLTTPFQSLLKEEKKNVRKIVFCSGKIYYDLQEEKKEDVLIVRIEQMFPLPKEEILSCLKEFNQPTALFVQEEPANMGYISYLKSYDLPFDYLARPMSSSPSTGYFQVYEKEQKELVKRALL